MKRFKFLLAVFSFFLFFISCKVDEDIIGTPENIEYVNTWILENMDLYYFWNDKLPATTDKSLNPDAYFESLLYTYHPMNAPDGDRFSWIQEKYTELLASLSGVVSYEIGFELALYYKDYPNPSVVGQVNYVKKGTPAETAGVKRGMFFDKVNGVELTAYNYNSLLSFTNAPVTIGFVHPVIDSSDVVTWLADADSMTLQPVSDFAENPVYLDTIFTLGNHRVGYFVYHFFAPDSGSKDCSYDLEMNTVFSRFKAADITDLVLDLRYNSGGKTTSSQLLASEIVPDLSASKRYTYYNYNTAYQEYLVQEEGEDALNVYFTTNLLRGSTSIGTVNNVGNQLGGKLYVLTGNHTASASEQVINGLQPFMEIILIGDTTVGKNVASATFHDEKHSNKNQWGIQPIIAKYFNSLGESDFTAGFVPDYLVRDGGMDMLPLGDTRERLLNVALNLIQGNAAFPSVSKRSSILQPDKLLQFRYPSIRGLFIENLPLFE